METEQTPVLPEELPPEHAPRRKSKKMLLDDNEGDYRVFLVHPGGPAFAITGQPELPKGTLIPLPQYPGFKTGREAEMHLRRRASQHHEMLSGQALALVKFHQLIKLELTQAVHVTMAKKPRRAVDESQAAE